MDIYLLLLLTYIGLVYIGNRRCGMDMISPPMVTLLSLTIVITLGYWYRYEMETDLYWLTYFVMATGGAAIVGTGYVVHRYWSRRDEIAATTVSANGHHEDFGCSSHHRLDEMGGLPTSTALYRPLVARFDPRTLYKYTTIYLGLFVLAAIFVMWYNTDGNADWPRMMQYRHYLNHPTEFPYNTVFVFPLSQMFKIALALTYTSAYVAVYNGVTFNRPILKGTGLISTLILFFIGSSIAMGARQPFIEVLMFMMLTYFYYLTKQGAGERLRRAVVRLLPIAVLSPFAYMVYGALVGRGDSHNVTLLRVTELLAGGIYALNIHIFEPARTAFFGQSSFADIYDKFANWGLVPDSARMTYHAFDKFGNTVTLYGRWYEDFGWLGVIIMSILVTAAFTYAYEWIKRSAPNRMMSHVVTIIVLTQMISLVWAGYDDRIRPLIAVAQCIIIALIGGLLYVLYKVKEQKQRS